MAKRRFKRPVSAATGLKRPKQREVMMTEPDREEAGGPVVAQPPIISNYGLVATVYVLYLVGFLTGITVLVGLVIAYQQRRTTDQVAQSHFQFQISTFWVGLLYSVVGLLTIHFGIGALILIW
jgi:uncharacterized membrane protein